jgi:hypothetical protein
VSTDYKTASPADNDDNHLGQTQRVTTYYLEQTGKKKTYKRRRSSKVQQQIDWRRNKLSEYLVKGLSLPEISRVMNIPYDTLYKDQGFLRDQARENMKNHIADLPFNIKQATDGLNKLISMLYDIQDLEVMKAQGRDRKTSDHVRVMAIGLIKDCIKEKIEILTSQGAINHALDFIEKAKHQIKEEFNEGMQQAMEQDKVESAAINDGLENNREIQSYNHTDHANDGPSSTTTSNASEEQELQQQEEEGRSQLPYGNGFRGSINPKRLYRCKRVSSSLIDETI